jgi:esterase/lipase superfamily enzyme
MSGRYDLTRAPDGFRDLLDGYYDDDVYFNMPNHYLTNIGDNGALEPIRRLDIKIIVGEYDPFLDDSRRLSEILWGKGVWHLFKVWNPRPRLSPMARDGRLVRLTGSHPETR